MTRVVCEFLQDANSARSRNRMRQSYRKVVPSNKSALRKRDAFTPDEYPLCREGDSLAVIRE